MKLSTQMTTLCFTMVVANVGWAAAATVGDAATYISAGDKELTDDQLAKAIGSYKMAVIVDPKSSQAHQRLGRALSLAGQLDFATEEEHKALQLDQSNGDAHCNLGWIYGVQQKYRAAIDEAQLAIAKHPENGAAYSILGLSLASLENYDLAVSAFSKAIEIDPDDVGSRLNLAAALGRKGDFTAAIRVYRQAIELDRSDAAAYLGLGAAQGKAGDLTGEVESYRHAVALAPDSPTNHGKLGFALSQIGDWRAAFREGVVANGLRFRNSSAQFMRMFLTAWAAIFVVFGLLFAVVFSGSKFKPQPGETVLKSFFLTFYKDKPGRFVLTNRRLVFVPEAFSQWFGSTRLSIELDQIEKIESRGGLSGGKLSVLTLNGSVYHFNMPNLVLEPLTKHLKAVPEPETNKTANGLAATENRESADGKPETAKAEATTAAIASEPETLESFRETYNLSNNSKSINNTNSLRESTIEMVMVAPKAVSGESGGSDEDENAVIFTVVPPAVPQNDETVESPDH